jgi:hypothetical protein
VLCNTLLRLAAPDQAAVAALEFPRLYPEDLQEHLRAAALLAECAALGPTPADSSGPEGRNDHARRAVAVLEQAAEKHLLRDPRSLEVKELDSLRHRPDFQALVRRLEESLKIRAG